MRLGFALEYSLGHVTHSENLKRVLRDTPGVLPTYVDLPFEGMAARWTNLPVVRSNWSVRASLGAYLGLRRQAPSLQAALFHTQVTSLFSTGLMRRLPSVVSLDATPVQYDTMGESYGHRPSGSARLEALKKEMNRRAFSAARQLVTWSQWAKDSVVRDYGVPQEKVRVIPPGIDTARWRFERAPGAASRPVRLLFVGGDFERKGGDVLLQAFQRLPASVSAELHVVTRSSRAGEGLRNVTIHHGVAPNSERLLRLFAQADLFLFPTRGDCLPLAIMEALAAGLPVITTSVGALPEAVRHGETGLIVPVDDPQALAGAILDLASDPARRQEMSSRARAAALEQFDAATNYHRLLETLQQVAG